jgi:hypothetical protein
MASMVDCFICSRINRINHEIHDGDAFFIAKQHYWRRAAVLLLLAAAGSIDASTT